MFPVTRFPLGMCHGDDEHRVTLDSIENGVREHTDEASADIVFEDPPTARCRDDASDGRPDFGGKTVTQRSATLLVVAHGFLELDCRFVVKEMDHFFRSLSMRR